VTAGHKRTHGSDLAGLTDDIAIDGSGNAWIVNEGNSVSDAPRRRYARGTDQQADQRPVSEVGKGSGVVHIHRAPRSHRPVHLSL
jgi:hypothetical protein